MRFLHISDLHFGKVIHGVSMLENGDQPHWVGQFLALTDRVKPEAVVIAGDVFDRSSPSGEAVALFSRLVEGLAERGVCVMLVAGNHDSGQRLAFARDILALQNVHIAGTVERGLQRVTLGDECGPVTFWLMPYVFPAAVAQALGEELPRDYDVAVRRLLAAQALDPAVRNVLVAHQNVTAFGAEAPRGGSESAVGGVGGIDYTAFDAFDYVALGHIHGAYPVGREAVRYAGSPLCYHFNETRQRAKGPLLVELGPKGAPPHIETLHIPPLHPMRELRGAFPDLQAQELAQERRGEYLRLILTDRPISPETVDFFQVLAEARGSVLMDHISTVQRFGEEAVGAEPQAIREKPVEGLFMDFYTERSGGEAPSEADAALLHEAGELLRHREQPGDQPEAETVEALLRFLLKQEAEA